MDKREWVTSVAEDQEAEMLMADGLDPAIIGVDYGSHRVVYSVDQCIQVLQRGGMSREDAIDYFEFNVRGADMGPATPIWCDDVPTDVG